MKIRGDKLKKLVADAGVSVAELASAVERTGLSGDRAELADDLGIVFDIAGHEAFVGAPFVVFADLRRRPQDAAQHAAAKRRESHEGQAVFPAGA